METNSQFILNKMEKDGLFLDCSEQGGKSTHTPGARGQGKMNEGQNQASCFQEQKGSQDPPGPTSEEKRGSGQCVR
jgi:hypothetical protein